MIQIRMLRGEKRPDLPQDKVQELLRKFNLQYQRLEDMIAAIGLPREKLCTYCWTGEAFPPMQ